MQQKSKISKSVVMGKKVHFGKRVTIWNYVVIGDNTRIGDDTRIGSFCDIGKNVTIGKQCNIQTHVTISNGCKIGDKVFIGPNSSLLNDKYPSSDKVKPPKICDNVVIGGGVIVLPEIIIGKNAVVAAGSVVTKDVPSNIVVMGMPARKVMTRNEYDAKKKAYAEDKI